MTGEGRFVIWWLLGYAAVNLVLGCWTAIRGRPDRAVIRRVMREGIGPAEAAWRAAHRWDGPSAAAKTAAYLLVDTGAVTVSQAGVLTAVPSAPEPADPVLGALLDGIRRRGPAGARIGEALDHADFAPYRSLLAERVPKVRRQAEPCRTVAFGAAVVVASGIVVQAVETEAPFPAPGHDALLWACAGVLGWGALWLCGRVWPAEYAPRWPAFDRYCRERAEAALAGVPQRVRIMVDFGAVRRYPGRRGTKGVPGSDGGAWLNGTGASSCGGCGGCGGG
ncbi:hypothetical protein [Streptomyces sp. NPDC002490]|uniref:hypothetical protein n=1 Tax=Streptomyces sp. NPDC002490 TaxID=3154416 RepID=UPI0033234E86